MINVTLGQTKLIAEQPNDLAIYFTNTSSETFTNLDCKLTLPSKLVILKGSDRIEAAHLAPGKQIRHIIIVKPKEVGTWELTSPKLFLS